MLGDEVDEGRQVDAWLGEHLAEHQSGVAHDGEMDRKAKPVAVFTPSLDQGQVTWLEAVAPGQGVASDRDAEKLGALVGVQEVTSSHHRPSIVHRRSGLIMDSKA